MSSESVTETNDNPPSTTVDPQSTPPILYFIKPGVASSAATKNEIPIVDDTDEKPVTSASHQRRVHFPADDAQLRTISIAPEPLSNQPLVSLGVTLQRYRAACQRLQLRPINSLLDQLSTMDDGRKSFLDRLDCLKIVNEKVDVRHIDAIEEILSRIRFHTLDIDSSFYDDASLVQLLDVIEYYESCTHLNLSGNRSIGIQGFQALTRYMRKSRCLERFDMNGMRFDDNSMLGFGRSLRLTSTLYELHLESCLLNGKMLQKFIQHIRSCTCLRELYLCDNRLQVQDSVFINEIIRTCGHFLHLLDLRSNALQDSGASHLASQLSQYDEYHVEQNSLQKLSLQANQLTQQGVGFLAKALLHNRTIRSLNLSYNNITNEGLFFLRDALLTNRTVNELILRNCRLTDQAAIALAEYVAESSTIQYIDLRENNIQASGICGMAIAIKNNRSLLKLDFDPIVSIPTNPNSLVPSNNNIDRSGASSGLLSMSNLRRMTAGLSSFASGPSLSQSFGGGGGTRELLEQKAKWMADIAAVCQRNVLIYEEELRRQKENSEHQPNGQTPKINGITTPDETQHESTMTAPDDVILEEKPTESAIPENEVFSPVITDDHNEEQPTPATETSELVSPVDDDAQHSTTNDIELPSVTPNEDDDEDNDQQQSEMNIEDQNSSSADDIPMTSGKTIRKNLRHSDSLYLIRKKKAQNQTEENTDDTQISSIEPTTTTTTTTTTDEQQTVVDGV